MDSSDSASVSVSVSVSISDETIRTSDVSRIAKLVVSFFYCSFFNSIRKPRLEKYNWFLATVFVEKYSSIIKTVLNYEELKI